MSKLTNKVALVTGGSRGIGAAIAQRLVDGGAAVVTTGRSSKGDAPRSSTFIPATCGLQTVADAMGASLAALAGTVPLGRFGDARDIAEAVVTGSPCPT